MNWTPLPKGPFTGIHWSAPGAIEGNDPYLVWAETDGFSGYGNEKPRRLPVAIELKQGTTIAELVAATPGRLQVPPVYSSQAAPEGLSFCTAWASPAFFVQIQPGGSLAGLVKRVELGLAAAPYGGDDESAVDRLPRSSTGRQHREESAQEKLLDGKVIGMIDDSLAVAHANFLDEGSARARFFWRQDGRGLGRVPTQLGYGHELTRADIDAAMRESTYGELLDEGRVYTTLGLSALGRRFPDGRLGFHALDTNISHGSHVMDLAAGPRTLLAQIVGVPPNPDAPPSWAAAGDAASKAALVAVQLDYQTVSDTSGGSLNVHVLDGLMYILSRCTQKAEVVVNVSFGTLAGPHDGTSLLEAAMDQLIALRNGSLQITLAAGNSYQQRTHANLTLEPAACEVLDWQILPDDTTQNFLEIWIEQDRQGVEISVSPPNGGWLPPLKIGEGSMWTGGGASPVCALIYPKRVATGERGTCALLAVAPTFAFDANCATAPSGKWRVKLTNTGSAQVTIDAYVERDDMVVGTRTGARQSHFEDARYDSSGNPGSFVDHPGNPSPIRRSGNFNSVATGQRTVSVGGLRMVGSKWAHYSPQQPDPDAQRKRRPGVTNTPDTEQISDESPVLQGVNGAGTRSATVVRLRGTSAASPLAARALVNSATSAPEASSST